MTVDQVRLLYHQHLVNSIVPFLGTLFSGGLITLGIMCMVLLASKGQGSTRQKHIAQVYVMLVVIITPGYLVETLIRSNAEAFQSFHESKTYMMYLFAVSDTLFPLVIIAVTNGLLVWRCFVVRRALGPNNHKLQMLFYIIPMGLWGITIGAGSAVVALYTVWQGCEALGSWCKNSIVITKSLTVVSNTILNLFGTGYIIALLLIHRQKLIHLHGPNFSAFHHTCITSILLESSAINAPVAILTVVHLCVHVLKTNFFIFIVACQAFMSILIVYQVAMDRAFRQRDEQHLEINVERATLE